MDKESTSFWAEIKKYEDILAKDPKSYCFAPLSELYRKIGLIDDAIGVAQRGTDIHPEYIGGYMALGRAYFEKGLKDKSKEALERVAKATPENILAQKILSQIYFDEGNTHAAENALQLLVTFNPEDVESRLTLDAMRKSSTPPDDSVTVSDAEDGVALGKVEDALSEDAGFFREVEPPSTEETSLSFRHDTGADGPFFGIKEGDVAEEIMGAETIPQPSPLPTLTLAELYASQGFYRQALDVYGELLHREPENQLLHERIDSLLRLLNEDSEGMVQVPEETMRPPEVFHDESLPLSGEKDSFRVTETNPEQMILDAFEEWLSSIRRIRECR